MRRGFVCSVAAMLAGTGLALAQAPAPSEAPSPPAAQGNPPVVGGGASPYSQISPTGVPSAPAFGLSPGGPGELMTCPGSGCGYDNSKNVFNSQPYPGPKHVWFNAEYLLWRTKTANIPSLSFNQPLGTVTVPQVTQVNGGTPIVVNQTLPVLMQSTATNPGLSWKDQPGMRFSGGFWFNDEQTLGIDAGMFMLWRRTEQFANVPNPSPTGAPFQLLIPTGFTDQFASSSGTINAATLSVPINLLTTVNSQAVGEFASSLWGTDFNLRSRKCYFGCTTIDWLAGVRYVNLEESIVESQNLNLSGISSATSVVGQAPPVNSTVNFIGSIHDGISTMNNFYGAQVGFAYDWQMGGGLFLSGWGKLAVGDNHEDIDLHGFVNSNGQTFSGGNLVGPADNNTHRVFDRIAVVPEMALNLGYQPCAWCRVAAGYTFLYMSSVARPGDQTQFVPTTSNVTIGQTTQTGNILAPTFKVQDTSFWAQGINFSLEFRY